MVHFTRRGPALALGLVVAVALPGCGVFRSAAPAAGRAFASEATAARQTVHTAVQNLDTAGANRGLTTLRTIADDAAAVAGRDGTPEARAAARQAEIAKRQAEMEVATGWVDEVERYGREKVKEELRKALRRAACDVAHEALDRRAQPDARQYAARVALYVHDRLANAAFDEVIGTVLEDLRQLLTLNPANEYDREVMIYLAEVVFCPDSLPDLAPAQTGWGFNLLGQPVTVVDGDNQPVGSIGPNAVVRITCTSRGFPVQGPYGTTSDLWDYVGDGFVPDSYLYTGTNEPVAGPC